MTITDSQAPKWLTPDVCDKEHMNDWVNVRLDEMMKVAASKNHDAKQITSERFAIEEAEHGNLEPLRRRYPHISLYLHPRKRKRGENYPSKLHLDSVQRAAEDVQRIRKIWQQVYGKKNRHADDGPSAEEIAARRWGVEVKNVASRLKNLNRHTKITGE